jgi:uncharacterized protein (TIGR03083 family)
VEVGEHIEALRREGELLATVATRSALDAPIPTTPEWTMRDLVRHTGDVHRWAAAHVAERRTEPIRRVEEVAGPLPDDRELVDWFRRGHGRLVHTLETAAPDVECWAFLPAPSALAFWARRQAHETSIHRADAESAHGERSVPSITPFTAAFSADGIDELLFGFFSRPRDELETDSARTLHLHATDIDGEWLVRLGGHALEARRGHGDAHCAVRGSGSDLYLLLWNRRTPVGLDVEGDASVLGFWREHMQIHWSRPR